MINSPRAEYGRCTKLVRFAIYIHHQLTSYIATPVIFSAFPAFFLSGDLAPFCSCRLVLSRSVSLAKYLDVLVELTASSTIVSYVRLCLVVYLWCNISTPIFLPSTVTFAKYVRFCLAEYLWCNAVCVGIIFY